VGRGTLLSFSSFIFLDFSLFFVVGELSLVIAGKRFGSRLFWKEREA